MAAGGRSAPLPLRLMGTWRKLDGLGRLWAAAIVIGLLAICGATIYLAGGTTNPVVHVLYLPILLGAIFFKTPGGIVTALVAALVAGPWIPLDAAAAEPQQTINWLIRAGMFLLVGTLAGQLQVLLEHRLLEIERLMEKSAATHAKTLTTFAATVELRDRPTGGHSTRVAHNARELALAMGLDEQTVRAAYWAGLLHDLGKIAVAERVLLKPGPLTDEESDHMRRHSSVGADLLKAVSPDFEPIAEGVRAHHERWDGTGYPHGLVGTSIPITGRIVAVVDVFEALTCVRPYRRPSPAHEAMAYLRAGSGSHFDPAIVPVFEDLYWRGEIFATTDPRIAPDLEEVPPVELEEDEEGLAVIRELRQPPDVYHLGSSGRP